MALFEDDLRAPAAVLIERALPEDVPAILTLQRLCYQDEATLYADWTIPPLTQTLPELAAEVQTQCLLVVRQSSRIVGSVRGRVVDGTCHIGLLVVHPDYRGQGLGSQLMGAIEAAFPAAERFELFTGHRSEANIRLYRRLGYREIRREAVTPRLTLVYLAKAGVVAANS